MATINNKFIWQGKNGPLLIAEIGGNHEGDFQYAKKLTKLAIKSGADVAKFQIYNGDSLVNKIQSPERYLHFKKFQLSRKEHLYLAEMCVKNNVQYLASVWDIEALSWIDDYLSFYKIGSGDLTCYPILKKFAERGKPIILSTGLSSMKEINNAINFIRKTNKKYNHKNNLAVMQCTSSYPTIDLEANLKIIEKFKKNKNITVGYSDHTVGDLALKSAYTLGAQILEFHFTDTRKNQTFRDHKVSLNLNETKKLIIDLNRITKFMGSNIKKPTISEVKSKNIITFRRGIYLNKNLTKGEIIQESDLIYLRPNVSIDTRNYKNLIGRKLKKNLKKLEKIIKKKHV